MILGDLNAGEDIEISACGPVRVSGFLSALNDIELYAYRTIMVEINAQLIAYDDIKIKARGSVTVIGSLSAFDDIEIRTCGF